MLALARKSFGTVTYRLWLVKSKMQPGHVYSQSRCEMLDPRSVPQIILISLHRQFSMRLSSNLLQRVIEIELYIPSQRATMDIGRVIELRLTSGLS